MLRRYNSSISILFRLFDVFIVCAAWLLSYPLRFDLLNWLLPVEQPPPFEPYAALTPFVAVLWFSVFSGRSIYHSRRLTPTTTEVVQVLSAHVIALFLFVTLAYFVEHYKYSRLLLAYFGAISAVALASTRFFLRHALRTVRRRGYNQHRVLVVGRSNAALRTISYIERFPELGLTIIGVVTADDDRDQLVGGYSVLGQISDVRTLCRTHDVQDVIVALPADQQAGINDILAELKNEAVSVRLIPDVEAYAVIGCASEDFNGMPLVHINDSPLDGWGAIAKRSLDIVGSIVGLLLFFPVMFAVAVAVKITSRGPIFYAQERMGLDGRRFMMFKFRSMKVDAENNQGAQWATKKDDRRTPIGAFLRKTSLDELPQLWNVLRGDMSLVGPRPERPVFVHRFRDEIPRYMLRHKVKAGITGWAQVNGWRGNTSLENRIECDLFYIRNWSIMFDIRILFLTIFKGFIHENAY